MTTRGRALGVYETGKPKISIRFEPVLFEQVNDHAEAAMISFNEAVRSLVTYAFDRLAREVEEGGTLLELVGEAERLGTGARP